jgi:DNA-binding CsgD family transcriptional regulator
VLEAVPQGVIVLSGSLVPVYWNQKAKDLCGKLTERDAQTLPELPTAVLEVGHRMLRQTRSATTALMLECPTANGNMIRISAQWLSPATLGGSQPPAPANGAARSPFILVFLVNCTEALQAELRIEQRKYDLTEREAEVWMLLRQEYTYQEIAKLLQISLNTVKTHVKNLYAKKRSCSEHEKFWYCE